jgi:uncharacterized membrane protein (UPF0127 family)
MIPTTAWDDARMRPALALLLLLAACDSGSAASEPAELEIHTTDGVVALDVEVADESGERATGLMGREKLDPFDGMAFIWDEPVRTSFWMKDTLIPLSIAFWNEDGEILAILDMEPCEADPCPTYDPGVPFTGALEVPQGLLGDRGVQVGDRVELVEGG